MNSRQRFAAYLLVGCLLDAATGTVSLASIDKRPRVETNCVRSRVVLRPEFGSSLADLRPGERMPLVQVRICNHARRSCVTNGEEVPLSQCSPSPPGPEAVGNLTTE
jgi:hypothetical protein